MVTVAQLAEHWIVAPVVVGSSPIGHPIFLSSLSPSLLSVTIQITPEPSPSPPSWFGEVVLIVEYLRKHGVLTRISQGVRFARRRFGHYEQGLAPFSLVRM